MEERKAYMKHIFRTYIKILQSKYECQNKFWDLVVLTTYDEAQKLIFENQIEDMFGAGHQLQGKIKVIEDPPGQKLGSGGSTLHVMKTLLSTHGHELYMKKILIIHSGGSSKRLPSYSVQGKIFSPIPIEDLCISSSRPIMMLDLKLAMYLPFCSILGPGIFVTCADDIETYSLGSESWSDDSLKSADVVALAHPCDLKTASNHGVYVLPDGLPLSDSAVVSNCLEVLQKPSISLMRTKEAVVLNEVEQKEMVYSDSVFWMSEKAYRPLLSWYLDTTLYSEVDAYAHFLTCLGSNMKDVSPQKFNDCRRELLHLLQPLNLKIIVLKQSKFYHLGTMSEYLMNFTLCKSFREELSMLTNTSNSSHPFRGSMGGPAMSGSTQSVAMFSFISKNAQINLEESSNVIIEWCFIDIPIKLGAQSILSSCVVKNCPEVELLPSPQVIDIIGGFLYHTVPILSPCGKTKNKLYVTVAFEIGSNLKQSTDDISTISIASVPLVRVMREGNLNVEEVLSNGKPFSLWTLKLFHASSTPEESFWRTLLLLSNVLHWRDGVPPLQTKLSNGSGLFSMKDIVSCRNLDLLLEDRKKLLHTLSV